MLLMCYYVENQASVTRSGGVPLLREIAKTGSDKAQKYAAIALETLGVPL